MGIRSIVAIVVASLTLTACGGGSGIGGDALNSVSLSDLPSASDMVGTSDSSTSLTRALVTGEEHMPLLTEISDDSAQYFWNGLIEEINTGGWTYNNTDRDDYWKGRGLCQMAEGFGRSFRDVLQAGTSACFMKKIPLATGGVTTSGGALSSIFSPRENARIARIHPVNMPAQGEEEESDEYVYIKTHGTSETGTNKVKYTLWFCDVGGDEPKSFETIEVNLDTARYTSSAIENQTHHKGRSTITGYLSDGPDGLTWDSTQPRVAIVHFLFSHEGGDFEHEGNFKSEITIDGDLLTTKMQESSSNSWNGGANSAENSSKRFLAGKFEGSSILDIKLSQVASKEHVESTGDWSGTWDQVSAADWNATNSSDGHYEQQGSGELFDLVSAVLFDEDDFYTDLNDPDVSIDSELYPCDPQNLDMTVEMDFSHPAMAAIEESCNIDFQGYNICNQDEIQQAERQIFDNMTWN